MQFLTSPSASGELGAVWPIALFVLATVGTFAAMLLSSWLIGERRERAQAIPYESGMAPTGEGSVRFSPHFYLVGMLFVIFDAEAVFLFAWAVVVREVGWPGFFGASFFVAVLLASLVWLWRVGALDWGSVVRRVRHPPPTAPLAVAAPAKPPSSPSAEG